MTEYVEWKDLDILKRGKVDSWKQEQSFYNKLNKVQQTFWNNVKTLINGHTCVVAFHCKNLNGKRAHYHIAWHYTADGRWSDKQVWRRILSSAKAAEMDVWSKRCQEGTAYEENLKKYFFKPGKLFYGCNDHATLGDWRMYKDCFDGPDDGQEAEFEVTQSQADEDFIGDDIVLEADSDPYAIFGVEKPELPMFKDDKKEEEEESMFDEETLFPDQKVKPPPCKVETSTTKPKVPKSIEYTHTLRDLMSKYKTREKSSLRVTVATQGNDEEIMQLMQINLSPMVNRIYEEASGALDLDVSDSLVYYDQFMESNVTEYSEISCVETDSLFKDWCDEHGIDAYFFLFEVWCVLKMQLPKVNCFALYGSSNAGKSFWLEKCFGHLDSLVGKPEQQEQFMWGSCVKCSLIVVNETELISKAQIDKFKEVAEGLDTNVAVKYGSSCKLTRKPMFYTSNQCPWQRASGDDAAAIQNRMLSHQLNKQSRVLADFSETRGVSNPNPQFVKPYFRWFEQNAKTAADAQEILNEGRFSRKEQRKLDRIYEEEEPPKKKLKIEHSQSLDDCSQDTVVIVDSLTPR